MLSLICLLDIQAETSSRQLNLQSEKKKVWIGNKKLGIDSVLILKAMRQEKSTKEYGETLLGVPHYSNIGEEKQQRKLRRM